MTQIRLSETLSKGISFAAILAFIAFLPFDSFSQKKRILFFGDSITAGYGIDANQAFPALIQNRVDSLGLNYEVINAGLSGETTAGGVRRIDWVLQNPVHILVLELGGNDGLRGLPVSQTEKNLTEIIKKTRAAYPDARIVLAGMQVPPNLGIEYTKNFREIFETIANEQNVELIPFILEDVGGKKELNLPDGIHPTPEGHKIIAETVWKVLF